MGCIFLSVQNINSEDTIKHEMEKESQRVVIEFLQAVKNRDHEKVVSLLDENVEWHQPGDNRISGIKMGRSSVMKMGKEMSDYTARTFTISEIKNLSANGNSVACILHLEAALPIGSLLDVENIDVYKIKDGKVVEVIVHSTDLEQENNFWGKPSK
jgi:ketosteroid isomerase-like protein